MNANLDIAPLKFDSLNAAIEELTETSANESAPALAGPGMLMVLDYPDRCLRFVEQEKDSFPNSFYALAQKASSWDDMVAPEHKERYFESWRESRESGHSFRYHALTSRRPTTTPVCEYRTPLFHSRGHRVGTIVRLVEDSFRSLAMDALIRRSWGEIATAMTQRLLHDFNNTIAGIYSLSEIYSEPGSDPQSMSEAMGHIQKSAARSQEITRKIRQLTTIKEGAPNYHNLETLLRDQSEYLQTLLPKDAKIEYELGGEEIPVFLDDNRFKQAILHLAGNAGDAAGDKVTIRIQTHHEEDPAGGGMARIDFSDNGSGIDDSHIGQVLNPFFTTKDPKRHLGLGLHIVKTFLEELSGSIEITRQEQGTTVSLFIPTIAQEHSPEYKTHPKSAKEKPVPESNRIPSTVPLNIAVYTWEDISRHPLALAMKEAGWIFRIHGEPGDLLIELAHSSSSIDGIIVFKSALDEKADPLISELGHARNCPPIATIAMGERPNAISENSPAEGGLLLPGTSKPRKLLSKLASHFQPRSSRIPNAAREQNSPPFSAPPS